MRERYKQVAKKGLKWVVNQQNSDGSIKTHREGFGYYKVPYLFGLTGRQEELRKLLSWVEDNYFSPNGDFQGQFPRGESYQNVYSYLNAWMVCGAQKAGYFQISVPAMDYLLSQQSDKGGFYSKPKGGDNKRQELMCTFMGGIAALYTGNIGAAKSVAKFLNFILREQPNPEESLFFSYEPEVGVVTEFPSERASEYVIYLDEDDRQWYFVPGIASSFLYYLYKYTNKRKFFRLSERYMSFAFRCSDYQFNYGQVCKVGWAAALLYHESGEKKYLEIAKRVLDYFASTQRNDGSWRESNTVQDYSKLDLTAEFTIWLYEILASIPVDEF